MIDFKAALNRIRRKFFKPAKYWPSDFAAIGRHTFIGPNCVLAPNFMYLDDYVIIQNNVHFISAAGKLFVKKYSVISAQCIIVPGTHLPSPGVPFFYQTAHHIGDEHSSITIEEDCWIGAGSTLLMKSHIGRGAIVAAGSVVTKTVPPYAVVAGNPAKIIGVKFSKDDIFIHEEAIYEPSERLTVEQINTLFDEYFQGVKVLHGKRPEEIYGKFDRNSMQFIPNQRN